MKLNVFINNFTCLVEMQVNRDKSLADAEFYKALKEIESNKVT